MWTLIESLITGARKLGNFLAAQFPPIEQTLTRVRESATNFISHPLIRSPWNRLAGSRQFEAAYSVFEHFWWPDYSKVRVDWTGLPPGGLLVLRLISIVALLLCFLLVPAMLFPFPSLPAHAIEGANGPVAAWSVLLWLVTLALAWGCFLAGAGMCNRPTFLISVIMYLWYVGWAATSLPRATSNLLIPLTAMLATGMSEKTLHGREARGAGARIALCMLAGAASGVVLFALTPLGTLFPGKVIPYGACAGVLLGLITFACARSTNILRGSGAADSPPGIQYAVALIALTTLAFFSAVSIRGGLALYASGVAQFLTVWTGYLWPVYYFIGVGIILKLLKNTRVITAAFRDIFPSGFFVVVFSFLLLAGGLITWAPAVFDAGALPWPAAIIRSAAYLYKISASWIWENPWRSTIAIWMRGVFLFDACAIVWLLLIRRLVPSAVASLVFQTLLAWFLITEYLFQLGGFAHTGIHSALSMCIFSIWLLWMLFEAGIKLSAGSSPRWPSVGRMAIYGGVLLFLLLGLHVRLALHDPKIRDEVYYALFRGIIDVGLPYFLYVYADRRIGKIPVAVHRLFAAFCLGSVLALLLLLLDKLAVAGWSPGLFRTQMISRYESFLTDAIVRETVPPMSFAWIALRGACAIGALAILARCVYTRCLDRARRPAALLFILMAAATGLASFSKTTASTMLLPLIPPRWSLLFTPYRQSLMLDANLVAQYFIYGLPALVLALAVSNPKGARSVNWAMGIAGAYGLHLLMICLWPWHEAWLRSTGLLGTFGIAGIALLLFLIRIGRERVEETLGAREGVTEPEHLLGPRARAALTCTVAIVLGATAGTQIYYGRLLANRIPELSVPVRLPAAWTRVPAAPGVTGTVFLRRSVSLFNPMLLLEVRKNPKEAEQPFLDQLIRESSRTLPGFSVIKREDWGSYAIGATAVDFNFDYRFSASASPAPLIGTKLLLRDGDERTLVITLMDTIQDWEERRWDLVRVAQAMR